MRLGASVVLAALTLTYMVPGVADDVTEDERDRFELFADCEPMMLFVDSVNIQAQEIGLTREAIVAASESRPRSARLYMEGKENGNILHIDVRVRRSAIGIYFAFLKPIFEPQSQEVYYSPTWSVRTIGTHGGDVGYVMATISQFMDQFLVEYLRVNEEACAKR